MTDTTTQPSRATMIEGLRTAINTGIKLGFDYTNASGDTSAVEAFTPETIREVNGDVLITGRNSRDEYRSYYIGRMENSRLTR